MAEVGTAEKLHKILSRHANMLPESLRFNKEVQNLFAELNKEILALERERDFADHALRITQMEKAELERKIAATKEKFDLASQASKAGVWEWSGSTGQIVWDDQMFRIYGIENKEQFADVSKVFFDFVFPDDKSTLSKSFAAISTGGDIFSTEFRIVRKFDSSIRNLQITALVKRGIRKEPVRMVGVCFDITERKDAETERAALISNLVNYNKDLEEFAFVVSHRLRSHTSKFQTAISILTNAASAEDLKNIIIQEVVKEARIMDETLRDLTKVLSLKEENKIFETVDIKELLLGIVDSYSKENKLKPINVTFDLDENAIVLGVRDYVKNIFCELFDNATKFQKKNEELQIAVAAKLNGNNVDITIQDNGIGMDLVKHEKKLFGLYRKFNPNIEGKGIGLHIVKKQMEIMGGKINISSELNQGTTIHLTFPKQK
jgi:signal transduction histidine kinase